MTSARSTASSGWIWGTGPTAVALKQSNGWTRGVLANHLWSFAVNTESSYDWENEQ